MSYIAFWEIILSFFIFKESIRLMPPMGRNTNHASLGPSKPQNDHPHGQVIKNHEFNNLLKTRGGVERGGLYILITCI